jgi:two-component system response regulator LytT
VIFIEAFGKDIEIHTAEGTFLAEERMYRLEETLDPKEFLRVSKSVIIAKKHVKKIRPTLSMKYVLTMTGGTLVDGTRSYYSEFRRFFGI